MQRRRLLLEDQIFGMPRLRPMLASPFGEPFDDAEWLFEVKWDGYRALAYVSGDDVYLDSRNRKPLLPQFPNLRDITRAVRAGQVVLDGEIVAMREGRVDFSYLRTGPPSVTFVVFDILFLDGRLLTGRTLVERKEELLRVVRQEGSVAVSQVVDGCGRALFDWVKAKDMEGIVAKRKAGVYRVGEESRDWLKVKNLREGRFWVLGYARSPGRTLGSLVVAEKTDGGFLVVGRVSSGLNRDYERELLEVLEDLSFEDLVSREGVVYNAPSRKGMQEIRWVRPYFGVEVSFTEMTPDKKLRHPVFRGLVGGDRSDT